MENNRSKTTENDSTNKNQILLKINIPGLNCSKVIKFSDYHGTTVSQAIDSLKDKLQTKASPEFQKQLKEVLNNNNAEDQFGLFVPNKKIWCEDSELLSKYDLKDMVG